MPHDSGYYFASYDDNPIWVFIVWFNANTQTIEKVGDPYEYDAEDYVFGDRIEPPSTIG